MINVVSRDQVPVSVLTDSVSVSGIKSLGFACKVASRLREQRTNVFLFNTTINPFIYFFLFFAEYRIETPNYCHLYQELQHADFSLRGGAYTQIHLPPFLCVVHHFST